MADRVTVVEGRAERLAHEPGHREAYGVVVARSFGSPAVTAESAVGFLRVGGRLVVSEPPEGENERWPTAGLSQLGLKQIRAGRVRGARFVELVREGPLDPRWPRRTGVPAKRSLW
jgi:16S rRNA (guanine527-N7)-methyltransferase